jgi:preprotein translocase subunit SecY
MAFLVANLLQLECRGVNYYLPLKLNTMNTIRLIGRLAVTMLVVILFEGLMTLGLAFKPETYNSPLAWIVQVLIVCGVVWFAAEWHNEETNK